MRYPGIATDASNPRARASGPAAGRLSAAPWHRQLLLPLVCAVMAAALLLISIAFAAERRGSDLEPLFWIGEVLLFAAPACFVLVRRDLRAGEMATVVVAAGLAAYLIKYLYGPAEFRFPDELQHWRSAADVLSTGSLFTENHVLPVSPRFPGLEIVTTAVVTLTGLSIFTAGILVMGVLHVTSLSLLMVLGLWVFGAPRLVGLACLLYAIGPHFQSFDAMFIYQGMALPFGALTLIAAHRIATGPEATRRPWLAVGVIAFGGCVVSHHVTSWVVLAALLASIAACGVPDRRRVRELVWLGGVAVAAVVTWTLTVGSRVLDYFDPVIRDILGGSSPNPAALSTVRPPALERGLTYAAVLIILVGLVLGALALRGRLRRPSAVLLLAGGALYPLTLAVRLALPDGQELAGRALTFVLVPVCFLLAVAVVGLRGERRLAPTAAAGATALFTVVLLGNITSGLPARWERLPGGFLVDAGQRGVSPEGRAAAAWGAASLTRGTRIGGDFTSNILMGSYGRLDPVRETASVFYAPSLEAGEIAHLQAKTLDYLVVDRRMARSAPPGGAYFDPDPLAGPGRAPLPADRLDKFDRALGFDRLYDSGSIVVFDATAVTRGE